ncbi:arsenate reductase ArsC [Hymenobacter sp. BT683]|uniref:Arsenate reductase ArsC n=1 Tax=Hymenobacter jeongseonensis TaxID=2791027 RepID=A0ABS0IFF7_9BACT|nr:arsenate reductase ArsC [Hymenobacter jeongseonensis]MBF9236907.1 arsenate reductase ArsC [Hymenobacter jeongseonensis]
MPALKNVLVLCTGNSCRSQLMHGYLARLLDGKANVYSAGIETHGVNPKAIAVMREDGMDISHHTSNHVDEYASVPFDYVITVCDNAREACPVFPSSATTLHHNFPDPAKATGTPEKIMNEFRAVRDQVKAYADNFTRQYFH